MFIDKTKIELGNYNNYSYRASQKTKKKEIYEFMKRLKRKSYKH